MRKEQAVNGKAEDELIRLANEWDRAMVKNDAEEIGRFMADDWTIIGPDGSVGEKATFLGLVQSGMLSHDVMESGDMSVRVYGDAAVLISEGVSGGNYQGQPFREVERSSCVFVRQDGEWKCVLTHLSRLPQVDERRAAAPSGPSCRAGPRPRAARGRRPGWAPLRRRWRGGSPSRRRASSARGRC